MASTFTNNLNLELMAAGDQSGTWGDPTLNQNVFTPVDARFGTSTAVALTSSNVALTLAQMRSAAFALTGILSANIIITIPLNANSATVAVGGNFLFDNACTGNFTVTVKTVAVGSVGVVVPQGVKSLVYSNGTDVSFGDSRVGTTDIARVPSNAGTPNGTVTGVAGTAYKPASLVYDRTNKILYAGPSADGNTGWVPQSGYFPNPQGYLTLTSQTAIIASDVTAATAVYYTPYVGNLIPAYDGSWLVPQFFSELTLTLTSAQAANQIYDVFAFIDSGTLLIGTGPAWATPTAGSGARGSGAGTTQLSRVNGLWTNAVSMTARNGGSTYSVSANQGTYLGSISMDATNGQVSCYRSWGQSRKWGVWNAFNRAPIIMRAGDATASWSYLINTIRPSNNSTANSISVFCGLAEEQIDCTFYQKSQTTTSAGAPLAEADIGVGLNSTTAISGEEGTCYLAASAGMSIRSTMAGYYPVAPSLGINTVTCLEHTVSGGNGVLYYGTETNMVLKTMYRG